MAELCGLDPVLRVVLPAAAAPSGNLFEMQILRPHPEREIQRMEPSVLCFVKPS